jgi:hypothetical protein
MSAWPSGLDRAPSCFTAHEFDGTRVQTPGADTVNQAVHPSEVGKLVAVSIRFQSRDPEYRDPVFGIPGIFLNHGIRRLQSRDFGIENLIHF